MAWSFCSQHWLFLQKPESLDPRAKYHSLTSGLGTNYTEPRQVSNESPVFHRESAQACVTERFLEWQMVFV